MGVYKVLIRYLFSHVGLLFMLVAYCIIGGYMFQHIERPRIAKRMEAMKVKAEQMVKERALLERRVLEIKFEHEVLRKNNKSETIFEGQQKMRRLVESYHNVLQEAMYRYAYEGYLRDVYDDKWSITSAALFCLTAITLIGYGHVTPESDLGRFLVIPYCLLSIPLTLMFLTNVGDVFARLLRFAYLRGCCLLCRLRRRDGQRQVRRRLKRHTMRMPSKADSQVYNTAYADVEPEPVEELEDEQEEEGIEAVPISLVVLVLVLYVLLGAAIFSVWEDWRFSKSVYYTFVTLTTIGFGDVVPGITTASTLMGQLKLAVACLYIITGLGNIGMGINLIVASIVTKTNDLGKKLGIANVVVGEQDSAATEMPPQELPSSAAASRQQPEHVFSSDATRFNWQF